jgi:hypothetical protein
MTIYQGSLNPFNISSLDQYRNAVEVHTKLGRGLQILGTITMVATAAIAITAAALISSTPIGASIFLASSLVAFLVGKDLHKIGTNLKSIGSQPLQNMLSYISKDVHTNKVADGTIFKPIWRSILNINIK